MYHDVFSAYVESPLVSPLDWGPHRNGWPESSTSSQSFPRLSFNGTTLANHSYVDLSDVGNDLRGSDVVVVILRVSS